MQVFARATLVLTALLLAALPAQINAQSAAQGDADLQRLRDDLDTAVSTFGSIVSQAESIPMFSRLISTLQLRVAAPEGAAYRELLASSLTYRARAHFNNGNEVAAAEDIGELLRTDPSIELDRGMLSPLFVEIFDSVYDDTIGYLEVGVSPEDAQVWLDGEPLEPGLFSYAVVAGTHAMSLERPGYQAVQEEVEIVAGESFFVEHTLERLSAVLRVYTRPAGARVSVDGNYLSVTTGQAPADFVPTSDAAVYPRSEFSEGLVVEGLQPGQHTVEVSLDGYRSRRSNVSVPDLADYNATVVLERSAGVVVLEGLPAGAEVSVDGAVVTPEFPRGESPRLLLEPGDHSIEVSQGTAGVFAADVAVVDERTDVLQVRLRPGLAFLGVLGGDVRGARDLSQLLTGTLGAAEDWAVLDRTWASPAFEAAQLTIDVLRVAGETGTGGPDWSAVQATFDREAPGSVYMLAVLNDDLLATHADLWIWPAAPGPAQPDLVRVRLDTAADVAVMAAGFEASTFLQGPWLGALLVDVGDVATVTSVSAGGPAEAAGLRVGDRVVSIAGEMVDTSRVVRDVVQGASAGTVLAVQVQRGAATEIVEVTLGASPKVISPSDPEIVYSVISASLAAELAAESTAAPSWVLNLNQAAVLMHAGAWEETVRTLRGIEDAPTGAGLGQATVEYWLGIALTALGPSYRDSAVQAFQRAATDPDARLYHNDGPWVAPRAAARLAQIGGGQ